MWSWTHAGNVAISHIIVSLHFITLARGDVSAESVRVTDSRSFAVALNTPSFTEIIVAPDRLVLGRRLLTLQGRDWPGQVASTIGGGRHLIIRSDPGDLVEIDFNRIPWVVQVGANSTLELRDLNVTNLATISKSGNGAFSQYFYVADLIMWPSVTSQPGGIIRLSNTTTVFWSRTFFKNPDCKYVGMPARPALEQATSLQGVEEVSTMASGVVQVVDKDVIMQLPVLSLNNNTKVGAMLYTAERSVAYCTPSLRSAPGTIPGQAEAPSKIQAPAPLPLAPPPVAQGKSVLVVAVSTIAAVAATVTAAATIALVLILRSRHRYPGDREATKPRFLDGKHTSRILKPRGSLVSLESHIFRQSRMRRLTPLGSEEVEIGPIIGRGSFGHVYKGRWRNTLVAIKMVEHTAAITPGVGDSNRSSPDSLQLEMLLSLSLCHPNIVATFRVCTVESGTLGQWGSGRGAAAGNAEAFPQGDQSAVLPVQALPGDIEQLPHGSAAQDSRSQSSATPAAREPGCSAAAAAPSAAEAVTPGATAECISAVKSALAPVAEESCGVNIVEPAPTAICSLTAAAAVAERTRTGRAASGPPPTLDQATWRDASGSALVPLAHQPRRAISLPRRLKWDTGEDIKTGTEQSAEQAADHETLVAAENSGGHVQDVPVMALSMQNGVQAAFTGQNAVGGRNSDTQGDGSRRAASARCCPCVGSPATVESVPSAARQPDTAHVSAEFTNKHPVAVDGAWDSEGEVRAKAHLETWMVMEYCERGSLEDMMRSGRFKLPNGHPNLPTIIACLLDIASGMAYLHAANVLHCDLKPANVLLKATSADKRGFICKLADFGLSRLLDITHKSHLSTQTYGTMPYMPPEMLFESRLTQATDVYSFAMIMWELFSAQLAPPKYQSSNLAQQVHGRVGSQAVHAHMTFCQVFFAVVNERKRPALDAFERAVAVAPEDEPMVQTYLDLMQRCWADEPAHRPPFTAILTELTALRGLGRRISAGRDSSRGSSS